MNKNMYALFICLLCSCSTQKEQGLRVAATAVPHAELLEQAKSELKEQGVDLVIIVTDDYNMPNYALANKEIDANFFQHAPFLEEQIRQEQYPIHSLASIELEPMGIYSNTVHSLSELKEGAVVALPNDPTNEARALLLLQDEEIIRLDNSKNLNATILNITHNPKNLHFIEVDAAMLPRTLDDVDIAVINTNFALGAGLSPLQDALVLEHKDSPYANIIVIRKGDETRADIQALKAAMTSDKMREYIIQNYKGALIPAF